jgi:hypothetical protein
MALDPFNYQTANSGSRSSSFDYLVSIDANAIALKPKNVKDVKPAVLKLV